MRKLLAELAFGIAAISTVGVALAQTTAGVHGTITDPTNSVVPNAKVTITNIGTQFSQTATTGADGIYSFTLLPVGTYTLRADASGFKALEQTGITLSVNQVLGLNLTLTLGPLSDKVEVTGAAPLVNTQTTEVGTLIGTRMIAELPLNTRNPIQLMTLSTGITREGVALTMAGPPDARAGAAGQSSTMSVNGNRVTMGEYLLDGTEFSLPTFNSGPNYPNPDALEEFRFIQSNYNAEFGKNPGGVMNAITKSGTNQFHGAAWEFNRNSALGTRSFFLPTKAFLNQNQFGFTFGGPIKKNKLFVFSTYQGLRIAQGRSSTSQYPLTTDERNGILTAPAFHPTPVRDPLHPLTGDALGVFPGNIIPASRIDPVATAYMKTVPLPNSPDGRWLGAVGEPLTNYQWMPKLDYIVNEKQRVAVSFFRDHSTSSSLLDFGRRNLPVVNGTGDIPRHAINNTEDFIVSHVLSLRPNLINQFRFAWVYFDWSLINVKRGPNLRDMGAAYPDFGIGLDIPQMGISGRQSNSGGNFTVGNSGDFQFGDSINYIRGAHSIKIGFELRRRDFYTNATANGEGAFVLNGSVTGDAVGDYLLGMGTMFSSNSLQQDSSQNSFSAYVQDDIKATRRLTVNLGLRYDRYNSWSPRANVKLTDGSYISPASTFIPANFFANKVSSIITTAPPGMVYPGEMGVQPGIFGVDPKFEPRVGLAWDVFGTGKTSLRAAAGFFTTSPIGENTTTAIYSAPFFVNYSVPVTPSFVNPFPPATLAVFPPVYSKTINMNGFYPLLVEGADINMKNGSVYQFNMTVQHQLPGRIAVSAGYVGNVAHHLALGQQLNPAKYIPGNDPVTGLAYSTVANVLSRKLMTLSGPQGPTGPYYNQVANINSIGNSNYHSLQVQVRKEFSHGLMFLTSYTWSKAIDDGTLVLINTLAGGATQQNPNCLACERALGDNDQRHKFIESFLYTTPDIAQRLLSTNNRGAKALLDAWQVGAIISLASGYPFSVTTGQDISRSGLGYDRPNQVRDPRLSGSRPKADMLLRYFDPSAFAVNAIGSFGNVGRNSMIGPGSQNVDFSVAKNVPISERLGKIQVRFEFFNFFNHANFGNPSAVITAPTVGRITTAGPGRIVQIGGKYTF